MCTAATYRSQDFYFGRTFDYEFNYGEEVVVTPRNYPFQLRHQNALTEHYAMIGIAHMVGDYPLYYDAVNEKGLGMAGLNFAGNAVYRKPKEGRDNIAQFEFIPWILADRDEAITIEAVGEGLNIYDNPVGVLTNNPPFDKQLFRLNDYSYLSPDQPVNRFSEQLPLQPYSRGMGAMGLPGDLSSASRFVRVAFTKMNSVSGTLESESVSQFFHILGSVAQTRGCCRLENGKYEITIYTSCCNADRGIYYYTTYENHQITAVDMYRENLDGEIPVHYPLVQGEHILLQNAADTMEENL